MEPLSLLGLFGPLLAVVKLWYKAHDNKIQTKHKCSELVERVEELADILRKDRDAVADDKATETTARVLKRLKDALDEALELINGCRGGGKYCSKVVRELDNVDRKISNCILHLILIRQAPGHATRSVAVVDDYSSSYNKACAGGSSAAPIPASFSVVPRLPNGSRGTGTVQVELHLPPSFLRWLSVRHHAQLEDPRVQTPVVRRSAERRGGRGESSGGGVPECEYPGSTQAVKNGPPPLQRRSHSESLVPGRASSVARRFL